MTDQPHYDPTTEDALIGRILRFAGAMPEALAHCTADDFLWEPRARIVDSAQAIQDEGMTITPLTVRARLSGETITEIERKAGMPAIQYLEALGELAPLGERTDDLAKIIAERAMRRRADAELEAGRDRLKDYSRPMMDCLGGVVEVVGDAAIRAQARNYLAPSDAVDAVLKTAEAAFKGERPPAIRTGLHALDEITGGFHAADLVIIAGRPGMGKSVFLSSVCKAAAQSGAPAILFSLEMPRDQIIQRLIADADYDGNECDPLHYSRFRSGRLTGSQLERAAIAGNTVKRLGIEIIDTSGLTISALSAIAERFAAKHKRLGVVAIDYLQIVAPSDRYRGAKVQEVTEISNGAKALAKRIGWPVVIGCQLNRAVEGRGDGQKRPRLADLRESGAIEQDADVVCGLYRAGYYIEERRPEYGTSDPTWANWKLEYDMARNDLDAIVLKNRNGPTHTAKLHVDIAAAAIRNRRDDGAIRRRMAA